MSALTIIVTPDAASIVTDSAAAVAGRLISIVPKSAIFTHLGIAAGFRGHTAVCKVLAFHMGQYADREEMLSRMPADFRKLFRKRRKILPSMFDFDIGIVGHDGREPFGYLFSSVDRPEQPAFTMNRVNCLFYSPVSRPEAAGEALAVLDDLNAAALVLLDDQRANETVVVGGHAEITTADADGFSTRLLARWPDRRLKPVDRSAARLAIRRRFMARPNWRES